ncbi:cadherin-23-like [Mytilus galloprovincialis]|uniref:cadherin-23-like n=1 Tax=Mytilus galloprovincialis TaxID=29158 RepID=UPI003F7B9488
MEVVLKLGIVLTLLISLSQKGLSQTQPPRFDKSPSLLSFYEGCSNRTLANITARGFNGVITISANDDATRAKVTIVDAGQTATGGSYSTTVQIKQKACMDKETEPTWYLQLLATDTSGLQTFEALQIYVLDVNDEKPSFSSKLFQKTVLENAKISTEVIHVTATDPDNGVGGVVIYSIVSAALYGNAFAIDPTTGSVTVNASLDYSKLSFYQYILFGTDGEHKLKGNATLIIKIQDIQNKPPYFTGQPFNADIQEESPIGSPVHFIYPIRADDGDTGVPHQIEYKLTEGLCNEFFEIKSNGIYGIVTVKKRIDRDHGVIHDVGGVCTLTLMALENVNSNETYTGPTNSTTPVVISILDVDDNLPEFSQSLYNATVFENLVGAPLNILGDGINVSDVDQDVNSHLHLELRYHNGSIVQGIKPVPDTVQGSGNVMLYLQDDFSFDFEKVQEVSFMLVAREEKAQQLNTQCIVHLAIIDRNDNYPQFINSSFAVHVAENYTNEQLVLSEKATDKDSGDFGEITYSLQDSRDIFIVNNLTGVLTKRQNVILDYEKIDEYVLILLAKDGGGNLQSAEVVVTLVDINDNPPVFLQSFYNDVIKETDKNFKITVGAFDRDQKNTINSRVEFDLLDSPFNMQNNFTITSTWQNGEYLGKISLKESLDYGKLNQTTIELFIKAKDFGSPSLSSTTTVTLSIHASENSKYNCICGLALTSLLEATTTPTCNATKSPPGHEIAETEKFTFRYEPISTKIITMVDSTSATYVTMSHDELTSLSKSSARTCNRVGWTTHKLNRD